MQHLKAQIRLMQKAFLLLSLVQFVIFGMYIKLIMIPFPSIWSFLFAIIIIASMFMCLFASGALPTRGEEEKIK